MYKIILMLDRFREYIEKESICGFDDQILIAVSGGIDSVALLCLFEEAGYKIAIAHCNFHLRGVESDADASFVASLANEKSIRFYRKDFNTEEVARERGISIQMAARDLRYTWFEEVRNKEKYDLIATAHNLDDVLETFFINLSRGTGIRGLSGIPSKAGKVIRPLLFASREEIIDYAEKKGIRYREDSSNASEKYLRNKIRHKLLPLLEEQNPSFRRSLMETITKLSETEKIFSEEMDKLKNELMIFGKNQVLIPIENLDKLRSQKTVLYEILADYNFGPSTIEDICNSLGGPPGKQFFSQSHRLVKDRKELILTPLSEEENRKYYIELEQGQIYDPVNLEWVIIEYSEKFDILKDPNIACLDLDMLNFPLILRHWQAGDYFQPFGMQDMKKMSDFLIDEKVSLPDKENVWLLAMGQKIVWVLGRRIDDRFKITEQTRQVLMFKYLPAER